MKKALIISASVILVLATLFGAVFLSISSSLDENDRLIMEELLKGAATSTTTSYYAYRNGEAVRVHQSAGEVRKSAIKLSEASQFLIDAFLSAEDRTFYKHKGVDIKRSIGAFLNYVVSPKSGFGASTITQQLVKNLSGNSERSLKRKLSEILRAVRLEGSHTKDEILEAYLNIVPMSQNICGVYEAAAVYFGKSPSELSLIEAATIAGITNSPARYDPYKHPDACLKKRNNVLFAMLDNGKITKEQYEASKTFPLSVKEFSPIKIGSWFVETARGQVIKDLSEKYNISKNAAELLISSGATIYLTEDPDIQKILEDRFENAESLSPLIKEGLNYAMVVNDVSSGRVVALIGGAGEKRAEKILNLAQVKRPPASVIKPLSIYAPAIDSGEINYATVFDDTPVSFNESEDGAVPYPRNSPDVYDGLITVKDAVRLSKNTVAVKIFEKRGAKRIADELEGRFGLKVIRSEGKDMGAAPLALGQLTEGVTLMELVNAYTTFPRDGVFCASRCYYEVYDREGNLILDGNKQERRVLKSSTAEIMNQLLKAVTDSGTARSLRLKEFLDVAGKTGTSSDNKDRLFVGYTPFYCAGIWCGYPESGRSVDKSSPSHLAIWDDIMTEIHSIKVNKAGETSFSTENLVYKPFCKDSGECFGGACELDPRGCRLEYGYFARDFAPKTACSRHITVLYDLSTDAVANGCCPSSELTLISLIKVDRSFPSELIITDAEYVYRSDPFYCEAKGYDVPYFYYELEDGCFVGKSKGKKQFNSGCYVHIE